jgi:hypothetical protein
MENQVSRKKMLCALVAFAFIAMVPRAMAQTAVMRGGQPAVECYAPIVTWSIAQVDLNAKPAFKIPVCKVGFLYNGCLQGTLLVTAERIIFRADGREPASFDESRASVTWVPRCPVEVRTARGKYNFWPRGEGVSEPVDIIACRSLAACLNLVQLAFSDFDAAEKQFNQLTERLPPARQAAFRDFQPKAAAWRALTTKPPLIPEADRHRILAENAIKEKDLNSAIEHFESALALQPMWPAGWFNLAIIYAEQNNYADATDRMRHYLELVPDAPDAKDARTQMIIWEDKAKH